MARARAARAHPRAPVAGAWETCLTINESWGYCPEDRRFKSARRLVHTLCEIAGKGGNLLLNAAPMGDGRLQPELLERLEAIGAWMARCGESITGTQAGLEPWQFYGPSTRRGSTVYLHLLSRPYDDVTVRGVPIRRVKSVRVLSSGEPLRFSTRCAIADQFFGRDPQGELRIEVPESAVDPLATVLAFELA